MMVPFTGKLEVQSPFSKKTLQGKKMSQSYDDWTLLLIMYVRIFFLFQHLCLLSVLILHIFRMRMLVEVTQFWNTVQISKIGGQYRNQNTISKFFKLRNAILKLHKFTNCRNITHTENLLGLFSVSWNHPWWVTFLVWQYAWICEALEKYIVM